MRVFEIATAAAIILAAAAVMRETFAQSGWNPETGPQSGWYPFWAAAAMGTAALIAAAQRYRSRKTGPLFASRDSGVAVAQLVVPMGLAVALMPYVGFYVVTGAYMALFTRWIGRYNWLVVLAFAIGTPALIYFGFEQAFKLFLPKSLLYYQDLSPF